MTSKGPSNVATLVVVRGACQGELGENAYGELIKSVCCSGDRIWLLRLCQMIPGTSGSLFCCSPESAQLMPDECGI